MQLNILLSYVAHTISNINFIERTTCTCIINDVLHLYRYYQRYLYQTVYVVINNLI